MATTTSLPTSLSTTSIPNNDSLANETRQGDPYLMLAVGLFISVDIVGVLANVFVLVVLLRNESKQVYEIFCTGLAITDLIFLTLTVPITTLQYVMDSWLLGSVMCKFTFFVINMTVVSSATMLLGLTSSRFLAVVHPWENRKINPARAKAACLVAWIFGAVVSVPNPLVFKVSLSRDGYYVCQDSYTESQRVAYSVAILLFSYVLPFFAILIMNCLIVRKLKQEDSKASSDKRRENKRRQRTKVTKMVMVVTSLYGICWFPTELINFWYHVLRHTFPFSNAMLVVKICATALHYASCCVNPIVYSMLSGSFRAAIAKQFPTFCQRRAAGGGQDGAGAGACRQRALQQQQQQEDGEGVHCEDNTDLDRIVTKVSAEGSSATARQRNSDSEDEPEQQRLAVRERLLEDDADEGSACQITAL